MGLRFDYKRFGFKILPAGFGIGVGLSTVGYIFVDCANMHGDLLSPMPCLSSTTWLVLSGRIL